MTRSVQRAAGALADPQLPLSKPATPHRPDIDGLRALAIIPVVLFHAGVPWLPGGFVGVDVFFVISGYLIGGIVFRDCEGGRFSLVNFYARRARRILPALFAVMTAACTAAALLLTPQETREFAKGAVGTLAAGANVVFYLGSGYFAPAAETNPLLMTWSLGVEEQFYVVFPLLLMLTARWRRGSSLWAVAAISAVSFAGSLVLTAINPQAAFYLLPTRAWELGIGAGLAIWEARGAAIASRPRLVEARGGLGLALVVGSIALYRSSIGFPGLYALAPTVGAALLISAPGSFANRRLAARPLVFIGLVSYSWYLWHWPLLSFTRIVLGAAPPLPMALGIVALSLALAVVSWRFVETPFRQRVLPNAAVLFRYGLAVALMTVAAAGLFVSKGWPQRFGPQLQAMSRDVEQTRADPCLAPYGQVALPGGACLPSTAGGALALIGDSHASALAPAARELAARQGLAFVQLTKASCPAVLGFARRVPEHPRHWLECGQFQHAAFQRVLAEPAIRTVVLASYWSTGMQLEPVGADGRPSGPARPLGDALDVTLDALARSGRQVVLLQDVPEMGFDPYPEVAGGLVPARVALARLLGKAPRDSQRAPRSQLVPEGAVAAVAAAARRHPQATLVTPSDALCDAAGCRFAGPSGLYYRDSQHLTASGARLALSSLLPATAAAPGAAP